MTNPSVTPLFSGSQILILISPPRLVMTCPHGLSASSPSTPLPSTHPAPSTLVLAAVPTHTRHVTSAASAQSLLITEGFPDPGEKKDSKLFPRPSLPSGNFYSTTPFTTHLPSTFHISTYKIFLKLKCFTFPSFLYALITPPPSTQYL